MILKINNQTINSLLHLHWGTHISKQFSFIRVTTSQTLRESLEKTKPLQPRCQQTVPEVHQGSRLRRNFQAWVPAQNSSPSSVSTKAKHSLVAYLSRRAGPHAWLSVGAHLLPRWPERRGWSELCAGEREACAHIVGGQAQHRRRGVLRYRTRPLPPLVAVSMSARKGRWPKSVGKSSSTYWVSLGEVLGGDDAVGAHLGNEGDKKVTVGSPRTQEPTPGIARRKKPSKHETPHFPSSGSLTPGSEPPVQSQPASSPRPTTLSHTYSAIGPGALNSFTYLFISRTTLGKKLWVRGRSTQFCKFARLPAELNFRPHWSALGIPPSFLPGTLMRLITILTVPL